MTASGSPTVHRNSRRSSGSSPESRPELPEDLGRYVNFLVIWRRIQGRRIRGFEGARAPPERRSAPSHCQKHPLKMKENLIKHRFKPISIKVMVVLTFILGSYLCKTAVIYYFVFKWTVTSGKAPPRVSTILHPWTDLSLKRSGMSIILELQSVV